MDIMIIGDYLHLIIIRIIDMKGFKSLFFYRIYKNRAERDVGKIIRHLHHYFF